MQYAKPELNQLGTAEALVLGGTKSGNDGSAFASKSAASAFEFEE